MTKFTVILLAWWLALSALGAQSRTNAIVTIPSASGQFVVRGVRISEQPKGIGSARAEQYVRLDPALLCVSCERIKAALLRTLGAPDRWQGRIRLSIEFTTATNQPIEIRPFYLLSGWQYQMQIPDEVETNKLSRAIVSALLLEIANRNAGVRPAEIPLWLTEGLTQYLLASFGPEILLRPYSAYVRREVRVEPLLMVQARLRARPALTFTQLGLPTLEVLEPRVWESFQLSSELFLLELLRLRDGQAALREMLGRLPERLNWQVTFLNAYRSHFRSLLDVEKWWALVLAQAKGPGEFQTWSPSASLDKLDEILRLPAQIRLSTNDLPAYSALSIQRFIELWDYQVQRYLLTAKVAQLRALRLVAAPAVLPLADAYLTALQSYMRRRDQAGYEPAARGLPPSRPQAIAQEAAMELEALDKRREVLRRQQTPPVPPAAGGPNPSPNPGSWSQSVAAWSWALPRSPAVLRDCRPGILSALNCAGNALGLAS